jgi:hypothetical protein
MGVLYEPTDGQSWSWETETETETERKTEEERGFEFYYFVNRFFRGLISAKLNKRITSHPHRKRKRGLFGLWFESATQSLAVRW